MSRIAGAIWFHIKKMRALAAAVIKPEDSLAMTKHRMYIEGLKDALAIVEACELKGETKHEVHPCLAQE